jgi:hypothetical protein
MDLRSCVLLSSTRFVLRLRLPCLLLQLLGVQACLIHEPGVHVAPPILVPCSCLPQQVTVRVTWDSGDVDQFVQEAIALYDTNR